MAERCKVTYPDDATVQCLKKADEPGTGKHEHYGKDSQGFEYTWRDVPTGGFDA
jgi:hypothetical protein